MADVLMSGVPSARIETHRVGRRAASTISKKLLKIGPQIPGTARRVWVLPSVTLGSRCSADMGVDSDLRHSRRVTHGRLSNGCPPGDDEHAFGADDNAGLTKMSAHPEVGHSCQAPHPKVGHSCRVPKIRTGSDPGLLCHPPLTPSPQMQHMLHLFTPEKRPSTAASVPPRQCQIGFPTAACQAILSVATRGYQWTHRTMISASKSRLDPQRMGPSSVPWLIRDMVSCPLFQVSNRVQ